jgi:hypothetical protein
LVRSKRKKSVERGTEQRRWSIVAWRQDAGEAVEGIESGPEAGGGGAVESIVSNLHCDEASKRQRRD